ncbi:MAG: DUF2971 domain-containing protein [Candidatus Scalindua sp.]
MSTEKPPSILYHYTSQEGILGIINNKEVWATDISYLNDTKEYKYTVDLTREIIKERHRLYLLDRRLSSPPTFATTNPMSNLDKVLSFQDKYGEDWIEYSMLDDLYEVLLHFKAQHIFLFSLSEDGNLLSQWRGYCPHGGYSIGFNTSAFSKLMVEKKGLIFVKCIYEKNDQKKMINNIIDEYINNIRKSNKTLDSIEKRVDLVITFVRRLHAIAPKLKSDSFKEEKEWRILTVPLKETNFIKFREGKSTIIPYIRIKIDDNGNMPIEEVIISPISHEQLSENAVKLLLSCKEIESCSVKTSGISYQST